MRIFTALLAFTLLLSASPVFADSKIFITVDGMTCESCAESLKKLFEKEENVNEASVSLDDEIITISTKDETELSDHKIKELIEWGGFNLIEIKRAP